jgi:hypothetical protein
MALGQDTEASAADLKRRLPEGIAVAELSRGDDVRRYWRTVRGLPGVAGALLRNGLMSSPPRRV